MPTSVTLTTHQNSLPAASGGLALGAPTLLASLPGLAELQADPLHHGRGLVAALGGQALRQALEASEDGLLLLALSDEQAEALPGEFAALPEGELPARCAS